MFVSLVFQVINNASAAILAIGSGIGKVFQVVTQASIGILKIGAGIVKMGFDAAKTLISPVIKQGFVAFAGGFDLIGNAATRAMSIVEQQIGKAKSLQQQFVGNASSLSAQTARSFDESYDVIAAISNKITELAAPLPGETQKYKDIGNVLQAAIIRGYVDKRGNVDFAGFGQAVTDLSVNYGALTMGKGMEVPNATLFLQRALNGSSFAELNQLEFGEKSPEVMNAIKNELRKLGHTELKSIRGLAQRAELLSRAVKPFVSEEFIERSAKTVEGITESFNTRVFDQRVGIFGMFREINDKGTGIKTAMEAYTKFLDAVIGDKGLFTKLGEFAKAIGIGIDPMEVLHGAFLLFTEGVLILGNGIDAATKSFKKHKNIFKALDAFFNTVSTQIAEDLGIKNFSFSKLGLPKELDSIVTFLGNGISNIIKSITSGGNLFSGIKISAPTIVDVLVKITNAAIKSLNNILGNIIGYIFNTNNFVTINKQVATASFSLGDAIGRMIASIFGHIFSYFAGLNWGQIFTGVVQLPVATGSIIGNSIVVALNSILSLLTGLIHGFLDEITKGLFSLINNSNIIQSISNQALSIFNGIQGVFQSIFNGIQGVFQYISNEIQKAFQVVFNEIQKVFQDISKFITDTVNITVVPVINSIDAVIKGVFDSFVKGWEKLTSQTNNLIQATVNSTKNIIDQIFANTNNQINGVNLNQIQLGQIALVSVNPYLLTDKNDLPLQVLSQPFTISEGYKGNIPNAARGLMSAVNEEYLNMPLGANIVVANDKEFILTPTNKRFLGSQDTSSNKTPAIGNLTININGIGKTTVNIAKEVANTVMEILESRIE